MKNRFVTDAEKFLARNRHHQPGWPRLSRPPGSGMPQRRVFVWGDLAVDLPIAFDAQISTQVLAAWRSGALPGCACDIGKPALGSLVGKAAPIAAELGFDVHVACSVSLPVPGLIRAFLECGRFDTRHVVACPGPTPLNLKLPFADRCIRISQPGISAGTIPQIPANLGDEFDAVLIDPGAPEGRSERLRSLVHSCDCETSSLQIGIVGRSDLSAAELGLLAGSA
jgi:hypothetical protein